ncbi:MAG: hypothetical protein PHC38_10390 [Weeksellaceae bacterium]|nr:hypothetical protein [Weeksellaceae bacterium]
MSSIEDNRMMLSIIEIRKEKAIIKMKEKKIESFVASVIDFLYDEDNTKVVLKRNEKTSFFPSEEDRFICYIKDIKEIELMKE